MIIIIIIIIFCVFCRHSGLQRTLFTMNFDSIILLTCLTSLESFIPSYRVAAHPVVTSASPPFDLLSFDVSPRQEQNGLYSALTFVSPLPFVLPFVRHIIATLSPARCSLSPLLTPISKPLTNDPTEGEKRRAYVKTLPLRTLQSRQRVKREGRMKNLGHYGTTPILVGK